jgi:chloride channel protein, CIC family
VVGNNNGASKPSAASSHPRFSELRRRAVSLLRNDRRRLLFDTLILGVAGAAAAQLFILLLSVSRTIFLTHLAGYTPPGLLSEWGAAAEIIGRHGLWLVPLATTLGGLIVGIITTRLAPEAEGHGTDAVIRAFHRTGGLLRGRVAPVTLLSSAITIGSGGTAGREGPIALIGGGVGSWYAALTKRNEDERRLLLLVGAAAGLSAIFHSPIGSAMFVVEVLYADMEFESSALLYTALAAIVAYAINGLFVGWGPLFRVPAIASFRSPLSYGWYALLGIASGLFATGLPIVFYGVHDAFTRLRSPAFLKPAIGGLLAGIVMLAFPQVISGGYGWMQRAIDGQIPLGTMALLSVAEVVTLSFTVASGGSGGAFAPSLFVGAMLGGACAGVAHQPVAPFVVVGMAAVFAGAAHVPFATMMIVTEMTGGYTLLVPAALAVLLSYLVQTRLSARLKHRSLDQSQVASRAESPAHHTQHLSIALRILREQELSHLEHIGEIDLISLLRSGISVELSRDRRLFVGVLRNDSPLVGTTIGASGRTLAGNDTNVIAILRGERMMAPRADLAFQAGDRLIVVADAAGLERLESQFDSW